MVQHLVISGMNVCQSTRHNTAVTLGSCSPVAATGEDFAEQQILRCPSVFTLYKAVCGLLRLLASRPSV